MRIEAIEIAADLLLPVASGVRRHENELDLISIRRCQPLQGQRDVGEDGDADVRAMGIAEEQQGGRLGWCPCEVVGPPGRVGQGDLWHRVWLG